MNGVISQILRTSNTHKIADQADSSAAPTIGAATASCTIRVKTI
jgi:hypothetical protein